jgi:predicted metal-binding protein
MKTRVGLEMALEVWDGRKVFDLKEVKCDLNSCMWKGPKCPYHNRDMQRI